MCQHRWIHTDNFLDRYEFEWPRFWYYCLLCGQECDKLPIGTSAENEQSEPY